jgi:ribose-phosphate pyrophosphokinase
MIWWASATAAAAAAATRLGRVGRMGRVAMMSSGGGHSRLVRAAVTASTCVAGVGVTTTAIVWADSKVNKATGSAGSNNNNNISSSTTDNSDNLNSDGKPYNKNYEDVVILSGTASVELTKQICAQLNCKVGDVKTVQFSDGEVYPTIETSLRGKQVFIIQSCSAPVNVKIMELLLTVTAARRSDPASVTAIVPYFGYRMNRRGLPISMTYHSKFLWSAAADFAKMLQSVGVDNVISVDLQRPGQGHEACFFDNQMPVETISANDVFVDYFKDTKCLRGPIVVVSPNAECVKKAQKFTKKLKQAFPETPVSYAAFLYRQPSQQQDKNHDKEDLRPLDPSQTELLGEVRGSDVVIIDDIVDTGTALSVLCQRLLKEGARSVIYCASHGIFSEMAMKLIELSPVDRVVVTDTIALPPNASSKVHQISIAPLLAKVIDSEVHSNIPNDRNDDDDIFEAE